MADPRTAARQGAIAASLPDVAVLVIEGPDARRWANGMFTQNIRDLKPGQGASSAYCDDRGRVLGLMDLYCTAADRFLVTLEGGDAAGFVERFAKFLIFDDVTITPTELAVVTVQGPGAADVLARAGLPTPDGFEAHGSGGVGRRARSLAGGFDVIADTDSLSSLLAAGAVEGASVLDLLRVEQGRPAWPADMGERAFPHELGIRDDVLHFGKGCYVGQEIINRMETRAKVRRHLRGLRGEGDPPEEHAVFAGEANIGEVTTLVRNGSGWIGLAILKEPHDAPDTEVLVGGHPALVASLPLDAG